MSDVEKARAAIERWMQAEPICTLIRGMNESCPSAEPCTEHVRSDAMGTIVEFQRFMGARGLDALAPECEGALTAFLTIGFLSTSRDGIAAWSKVDPDSRERAIASINLALHHFRGVILKALADLARA